MNVRGAQAQRPSTITGVNGDEVPPVPIPNTEVKLIRAESTWLDTAREDMSMPVSKTKNSFIRMSFLFYTPFYAFMAHLNALKRFVRGVDPIRGVASCPPPKVAQRASDEQIAIDICG